MISRPRRAWAALAAALLSAAAAADEPVLRRADPWVPPAARQPSLRAPTEGTALQAQVTARLLQRFAAADPTGYGSITPEQARRAGLGFVSRHFDQIDLQRSGSVSFEDLRRYLARRSTAQ